MPHLEATVPLRRSSLAIDAGAPLPAPSERTETLVLPDGRRLAYAIYGRARGTPMYFFHGFPGSRRQAELVHAEAFEAGIELVAFDRPGFGHSGPAPAATVDSVIGDVADLSEHLGHHRFGAIGVSCGGPYALATAKLMPEKVIGVGLLAGMGPMDRPDLRQDQLPVLGAMFGLARLHRWLTSPLLAIDGALFRTDAERAVRALASMLSAPDRALLERHPRVRAAFGASLADAYRQGIRGAMQEAQRIARYRVADLGEVPAPVHVFQSGHDRHVPPAMGRFLAAAFPKGRYHDCPDEGHLSIVVHRFADCARLVLQGE
jgi:pimeloyl-ACP methyl ester carboxylesterase